jgi:hypothetical protein
MSRISTGLREFDNQVLRDIILALVLGVSTLIKVVL